MLVLSQNTHAQGGNEPFVLRGEDAPLQGHKQSELHSHCTNYRPVNDAGEADSLFIRAGTITGSATTPADSSKAGAAKTQRLCLASPTLQLSQVTLITGNIKSCFVCCLASPSAPFQLLNSALRRQKQERSEVREAEIKPPNYSAL